MTRILTARFAALAFVFVSLMGCREVLGIHILSDDTGADASLVSDATTVVSEADTESAAKSSDASIDSTIDDDAARDADASTNLDSGRATDGPPASDADGATTKAADGSADTAADACRTNACGGCGPLAAAQKICGGLCVDPDPAHGCSATGCAPCPAVQGTATCDTTGACALTCNAGYKLCNGSCVSIGDPTYGCGASSCSNTACPSAAGATLVCNGNTCTIGTCGAGTKLCGSLCVPTDSTTGCQDTSRCTKCAANESCVSNGGAPTTCQCVPEPKAVTCARVQCGVAANNCGATMDCGTAACAAPLTCAGAGTPNACGCTDEPSATTCSGGRCGTPTNNCGHTVTCPTSACTLPQTCAGGGVPNVCGTACTGTATRCVDANGSPASGPDEETCNNGQWGTPSVIANQCGALCTPGATRCVDANGSTTAPYEEICNGMGQWGSPTVIAGQCGAVCTPGDTQCCEGCMGQAIPSCGVTPIEVASAVACGTWVQFCSTTGQWVHGAGCGACGTLPSDPSSSGAVCSFCNGIAQCMVSNAGGSCSCP